MLNAKVVKQLYSMSAKAIKISMYYPDPMTSFVNIHTMNERAIPESILLYKLSIQLFKLYNSNDHTLKWISLNWNQILTSRQSTFLIMKTNEKKVGLNNLTNSLSVLNGKIPLEWLNSSLDSLKVKCKNL